MDILNISERDVLNYFNNLKLNKNEVNYIIFHRKRYAFLLNLLSEYTSKYPKNRKIKILDIGAWLELFLIKKYFNNIIIDSLGFIPDYLYGLVRKHTKFDLNELQDYKKLPIKEKYDIIIMTEVIRYLYIRPELLFNFIKKILKPDGFLIVQSLNAVSLDKRINMFFGRNPHKRANLSKDEPYHFGEYTLSELILLGKNTGFNYDKYYLRNYYNPPNKKYRFLELLLKIYPNFREGITIIYGKK